MSARANCGAQAYASDTLALRQAVDDLLSDVGRIGQMTPLDHWEWARRLPEGEEPRQLPGTWSDAVEARSALDERELHHRRAAALRHWGSRKRVLDPAWQAAAGPLPWCRRGESPAFVVGAFPGAAAPCASRAGAEEKLVAPPGLQASGGGNGPERARPAKGDASGGKGA